MTAMSMSIAAPGPGGYVLGGLLLAGSVAALLWLRWSGRRSDQERRAEVLPPPWPPMRPEPQVWTPVNARPTSLADVQGRRPDAATQLIPRVRDERDATAILPNIRRQVRRG